jgi:hypothetical protein
MGRLNRDTIIAIVLLMACGVLFWATFDIREPDYGQLKPSTWPRVVLAALSVLCVLYLVQSLRQGPDPERPADEARPEPGVLGWIVFWRNPIWCFALFLAYLVTLPYLGSLIGGLAFVFTLMSVLGGWAPRNLALHALLAVVTVGGMWCIFTFGLGVLLPPGEIFSVY